MNTTEDLRGALRDQEQYAPAASDILNDLNSRRGQRRRNPRWSVGLFAAASVAAISIGVTALAAAHTAIPVTPSVVVAPLSTRAAPSATSQPSTSATRAPQRSSAQQTAGGSTVRKSTQSESATKPFLGSAPTVIPLAVAPDPPVQRPDGTVASPGAFVSGTVAIGPNGCAFLRPQGLPLASLIPTIWPYGMTARSKGGIIQVVDSHGNVYTDSRSVIVSGAESVSINNSTDPCLKHFTEAIRLIRTDGK